MGTVKKIYIVHGWLYDTSGWQKFVELLTKAGYTPVLLSVPGLTAPIDRPWTLDDYVVWLKETLKDETEPVILLGHSNGGRISTLFASRYPEKVRALILIGAAGIYHNDLRIRLKRAIFGTLASVGKLLGRVEFLRRILYKLAREHDYEKATPMMRKTMANLITVDLVPTLAAITVPTLLIWGRNDGSTPLSDGYRFKEGIANSQLVIIDGARHSPHVTHPEEVFNQVQSFFNHGSF